MHGLCSEARWGIEWNDAAMQFYPIIVIPSRELWRSGTRIVG